MSLYQNVGDGSKLKEILKELFDLIDKDGNGHITDEEGIMVTFCYAEPSLARCCHRLGCAWKMAMRQKQKKTGST